MESPLTSTFPRINAVLGRSSVRLSAAAQSYLFLTPWLLLSAVFLWYPVFATLRYAFYNWHGFGRPEQFVGLRHFARLATDPIFWQAVGNVLIYTAVLVPVQLSLALILALLLNRPRQPGTTLFRGVFFLPAVCSVVILAMPTRYLIMNLSRSAPDAVVEAGLFNPTLGFLQDPFWAMTTIIAFGIWHSLGYNLVFFLAALQTIPSELLEAATIDGAGFWSRLYHIALPLIRPLLMVIVLLAVIGSLRVLEPVLVFTDGGPFYATEMPMSYIYHLAVQPPHGSGGVVNLGGAAAATVFFSMLQIGLLGVLLLLGRRGSVGGRA